MADKEPRRRKKKRDMSRKDDVRSDDQMFAPLKSESRDSDQEAEEEFIVPSHQPSKFAKCVFLLLFSGLVISMSFIFISLHGAEKGPVDIFDDNHVELQDISHEGHDEIESWSDHESLEEDIRDVLPGIGSILSFNDEQIREQHDEISIENVKSEDVESEKMDIFVEPQAD
ncbi:uncharacterized protein LOC118198330, partial [Stegodyphus dumicola]|uniref:uncharacterized protein LOC118198330 n=1 Tax=Stegodyphus dumicola TaxID=202533 RepID=UPI0015ABB841